MGGRSPPPVPPLLHHLFLDVYSLLIQRVSTHSSTPEHEHHSPGAYCRSIHGRVFSSRSPALLDEWLGDAYGMSCTPLAGSCFPSASRYEAYCGDAASVCISGVC